MIKKILVALFTVLGIFAGLIIFGFFVLGKWIELDCERAAKTIYEN